MEDKITLNVTRRQLRIILEGVSMLSSQSDHQSDNPDAKQLSGIELLLSNQEDNQVTGTKLLPRGD